MYNGTLKFLQKFCQTFMSHLITRLYWEQTAYYSHSKLGSLYQLTSISSQNSA